jgi:hypothetical protein
MRQFTDRSGITWTVSETRDQSPSFPYQREGHDMPRGWLEFICNEDRRRLRLYPDHWVTLTDQQLEELCARAREKTRGR